jgi:hypothetical protein
MARSPILEPAGGLPPNANSVEVSLWTRRISEGVYDTNVPKEAFYRAMERASHHGGYSVRSTQFKSYHARDMVLENLGHNAEHRVHRMRGLSYEEIPGAPLVAVVCEKTRLPLSAFSCGAELHDTRYVRRLRLRVHRRARLVFDAYRNGEGAATVRRIYLDIDVAPRGLADDMQDLKRTVENTVQVVLLGQKPKRSAARS